MDYPEIKGFAGRNDSRPLGDTKSGTSREIPWKGNTRRRQLSQVVKKSGVNLELIVQREVTIEDSTNLVTSVFLLLLLSAVTLPAASAVKTLQAQDNSREIQVPAGTIIEFAPPETPGLGSAGNSTGWMKQHFGCRDRKQPLVKNLPGGAALRTWRLQAENPGESRLALDYFRHWEGEGTAVKHFWKGQHPLSYHLCFPAPA